MKAFVRHEGMQNEGVDKGNALAKLSVNRVCWDGAAWAAAVAAEAAQLSNVVAA